MALNSPCSFPWIPGSKVKGNPWHMSVPKKVSQSLGMALLKYHILIGNSSWLYLIMISPGNLFCLDLLILILTYQMALLFIRWTIPYYLIEVLTPFFLHQMLLVFVWLYKIFISIMVVNNMLILETGPPQWFFTRAWCMWLSINLTYGGIYNSTCIILTAYHTWELVSIKDDL